MKTKIFVTTGSILDFDLLIEEIDKININNEFDIICQTGIGKYIPKTAKHFNFKETLDKEISCADIVITHTGAGTIFELLEKNKKIICISNPKAIDNHELAKKLSDEKYLLFLKNFNFKNLRQSIYSIDKMVMKKYNFQKSTIGQEILNYIKTFQDQ